jgi:hypothetical protein
MITALIDGQLRLVVGGEQHVVVLSSLIEPRKDGLCSGRNMRDFVVLSHEVADVVYRIESDDRRELHLVPEGTAEEVSAAEAGDLPGGDPGEYLRGHDPLMGVGVFDRRPSVPDSTDHASPLRVRDAVLSQQMFGEEALLSRQGETELEAAVVENSEVTSLDRR